MGNTGHFSPLTLYERRTWRITSAFDNIQLTDVDVKVDLLGGPKNGTVFWYTLTLSNINRFSKLFHFQNQEKMCNKVSLKISPHLKCVATLPCEISSVLKTTIENMTTSVTTHF